jgi:hypothetical protein
LFAGSIEDFNQRKNPSPKLSLTVFSLLIKHEINCFRFSEEVIVQQLQGIDAGLGN